MPVEPEVNAVVVETTVPVAPVNGTNGVAAAAGRALDAALDVAGGLAAAVLGAVVANQVALRAGIRLQPRPMPHQMAAWLEHPMRLRYRNPAALMTQLGLFNGMTVADLGCGTGLFTVEMARMVGTPGKVHAVDLQAPMVAATEARAAAAGYADRIVVRQAGLHSLPLPDQSIDVALMVATVGEVPAPVLALDEVRRILKPNGRLAISEELPDPGYVPAPVVKRWAQEAGLHFGGQTGTPFCYLTLFFADA